QARRFLERDKQVLRFYAIWDDPSHGGVRRRYEFLFYLQDETCQLRNIKGDMVNSGRDEGLVYLRRQRLPKDWRAASSHSGVATGPEDRSAWVEEGDLRVGGVTMVWGRALHLIGCDQFTQDYYRHEHGIDMPMDTALTMGESQRNDQERHHNAHGRRSCPPSPYLSPSNPDPFSPVPNLCSSVSPAAAAARSGNLGSGFAGGRVRCRAVLAGDCPTDRGREFVVTYHLSDDTLMVHELQLRNSGRPGGRFLARGRYPHPDRGRRQRGRCYVPQDLFLGATLPLVKGNTLVVTEMDRGTLRLCERFAEEFPLMDVRRVLRKVAQTAMRAGIALR
ncbi:unnamed protein product, partial [Discosporangium mesarthrocarpum]